MFPSNSEEILSIVAVLSVESVVHTPHSKVNTRVQSSMFILPATMISFKRVILLVTCPILQRDEALAARRKFVSAEGDHITYLNIYRAYKGVSGNKVRDSKVYTVLSFQTHISVYS